MRRQRLAVGVVLLAAAAGCGGSTRTISTTAARSAALTAGFSALGVVKTGSADFIYAKRRGNPVAMPLTITRLANSSAAARRYKNDQPLRRGQTAEPDRPAMPRGFKPNRFSEVQICNLVLTSYNPTNDSALTRRFARLVELLRKRC